MTPTAIAGWLLAGCALSLLGIALILLVAVTR